MNSILHLYTALYSEERVAEDGTCKEESGIVSDRSHQIDPL